MRYIIFAQNDVQTRSISVVSASDAVKEVHHLVGHGFKIISIYNEDGSNIIESELEVIAACEVTGERSMSMPMAC